MKPGPSAFSSVIRLRAWRVGLIALPIQVCYFSIFYLGLRTGLVFAWQQLLLLIFGLWLYLGYIVLVNDFADRNLDASVGKGTMERGHGLGSSTIGIILAAMAVINAIVVAEIGAGLVFDSLWVLAYVLGTTYSLPPFSLKRRGAVGLLADAAIEKPIPVLIVFAFFGYFGIEVLFFPLLGELLDAVFKHQARDLEIDVKSNVRTYAVVLGKRLSDRIVEVVHGADVLAVTFAFTVVSLTLREVRVVTVALLAMLLAVFGIATLKFRNFFFHPSTNWSAPAHWADPPFVVLFNAGFQSLLIPTLGIELAIQSPAYLPLLVLYLISLAPYLVGYAVVALVRLKILGARR